MADEKKKPEDEVTEGKPTKEQTDTPKVDEKTPTEKPSDEPQGGEERKVKK